MPPGDLELLEKALRGDPTAFRDLVDRHAEGLFRIAYSLVGNTHDAEDALQETLIAAFRGLSKFRKESSLKTWLTRILMRQCAGVHRVRSARKEVRGDALASAASDDAPADLHIDVAEVLGRLSPDHRDVIALREFQSMSYTEIAYALDIPLGTVESRLSRARAELKELLKDYLP